LHQITAPVLLVWGKQDQITPPFVGEQFHKLIANSKLVFLDQCGHAPMMEHEDVLNEHLAAFLLETTNTAEVAAIGKV
jgi:pimeloyl-ACP methyl ester carboxylesterase